MNKAELITAMAEKAGLTKADSRKALESFMEVVKEQMQQKERISLVGFGSFSISHKKARNGVNPKNQKPLSIPAKNVVKFKPGVELQVD